MRETQGMWNRRIHAAVIALMVCCICVVFVVGSEPVLASTAKPARVTQLKAKSVTCETATLTWKKAKNATAYKVYKSTSRFGSYKLIKTVKKTGYTATGLKMGYTYWFKVKAANGSKSGSFSWAVKVEPTLKKPTVSAKTTASGPVITAKAVKGADGYVFYRNGTLVQQQKSRKFTDTDKSLKANTDYKYTVAARKQVGSRSFLSKRSSAVKAQREVWNIAIQNNTTVPTITQGQFVTIAGKISSNLSMTKVEVGVVKKTNGKWAWVKNAKYQNSKLNKKSFDIGNADETVKFSKLKAGTYRYRIYAHSKNGTVKTLNDQTFKVKSKSANAGAAIQGAVNWAVNIANDDSYTYGVGTRSHRAGCAICGTNTGPKLKKKEKKGEAHYVNSAGKEWKTGDGKKYTYDKTYVCLTFLGAAFAHGAKDSELLARCKAGKSTFHSDNKNFTDFSCWLKIGTCKEMTVNDLQVGDVIVKWGANDSGGHVCMYIGDGYIVHAWKEGWDKDSICVQKKAEYWLNKAAGNSKSYVMRYNR